MRTSVFRRIASQRGIEMLSRGGWGSCAKSRRMSPLFLSLALLPVPILLAHSLSFLRNSVLSLTQDLCISWLLSPAHLKVGKTFLFNSHPITESQKPNPSGPCLVLCILHFLIWLCLVKLHSVVRCLCLCMVCGRQQSLFPLCQQLATDCLWIARSEAIHVCLSVSET